MNTGLNAAKFDVGRDTHRVLKNGLASAYASSINYGDPIALNADGQFELATGATEIYGVFEGVEGTDSVGEGFVRPAFPANLAMRDNFVLYTPAKGRTFRIQADGPLTQAAMGKGAVLTGVGTSVEGDYGFSAAELDASSVDAGPATVEIIGLVEGPTMSRGVAGVNSNDALNAYPNDWDSAKPILLVKVL